MSGRVEQPANIRASKNDIVQQNRAKGVVRVMFINTRLEFRNGFRNAISGIHCKARYNPQRQPLPRWVLKYAARLVCF
jgi:hypothetical protein